MYTIVPMSTLNDPEQCTETEQQAVHLGKEFIRKFGGPECPEIAIVEIRVIGRVEYVSPIFHDERVV